MKIVLVGGPYSRAAAHGAVAFADALAGSAVALYDPPPGLAEPGGDAVPRLLVAYPPLPDGRYDAARLAAELTALLADRPPALALDGAALLAMLNDFHGSRAAELPAAATRVLFWLPDRPRVIVHFCDPPTRPHFARAWGQYVLYAPSQAVEDATVSGRVDLPGERVARHAKFGSERRRLGHPWTRLKGRLAARLARLRPW